MKNHVLQRHPNVYGKCVHFWLPPSFDSYLHSKCRWLEHIMDILIAGKKMFIRQFPFKLIYIIPFTFAIIDLPMSMLMRVSFLWGIIQRYHGINFWTEDRFDYICLLVYQPQIKRTKVEFRRQSVDKQKKIEKLKYDLEHHWIFCVYTYSNHQHIWIRFPFDNIIRSMFI